MGRTLAGEMATAQPEPTLTAVIEECLRRALAADEPDEEREPYYVASFASKVRPGVDLDADAATLEAMEG